MTYNQENPLNNNIMDKSTDSLSDSDSNTSSSWVFVDQHTPTDLNTTNQFYLNCSKEPVQELTEQDLGIVGSDGDSDTDGISVISESEENLIKDPVSEDSSDDGTIIPTKNENKEEVNKNSSLEESIENLNSEITPLTTTNNSFINGINWKKFLSTGGIVGSGIVIFAILLAPYFSFNESDDTVIYDNNELNTFNDYFDDNKPAKSLYDDYVSYCNKKHKLDDYSIKKCIKLYKKTRKQNFNHAEQISNYDNENVDRENKIKPEKKQLYEDYSDEQAVEVKYISEYKKHRNNDKSQLVTRKIDIEKKIQKGNKAKIKKYHEDKEFKVKNKKQKHKHEKTWTIEELQIQNDNGKKKEILKKRVFKDHKNKKQMNKKTYKYDNLERYDDLTNDFLEKERKLKEKEKYLLKKEEYLAEKEQKLLKKELKIARKGNYDNKYIKKKTLESKPLQYERKNRKENNFKPVITFYKKKGLNNSVSGEWYYNLSKGRNEIRKKEHTSDWVFDRAQMRSKRRDKAHWYFQWMTDRAQLRFKRSS